MLRSLGRRPAGIALLLGAALCWFGATGQPPPAPRRCEASEMPASPRPRRSAPALVRRPAVDLEPLPEPFVAAALAVAPGLVRGVLHAPAGADLPSPLRVRFEPLGGAAVVEVGHCYAAADGWFESPPLPVGRYALHVDGLGTGWEHRVGELAVEGGRSAFLSVELPAARRLRLLAGSTAGARRVVVRSVAGRELHRLDVALDDVELRVAVGSPIVIEAWSVDLPARLLRRISVGPDANAVSLAEPAR